MADDIEPRDELEIQIMRDMAKSCHAIFDENESLAKIIGLAQDTYDTTLRDVLRMRLDARLADITALEHLLRSCGKESDDPLANAQRRRNLRQNETTIAQTRERIQRLAEADEKFRGWVGSYNTSRKTADGIDEASKIVANVGHRMIRFYNTARRADGASTDTRCGLMLVEMQDFACQLDQIAVHISGSEETDPLAMQQREDDKWKNVLAGFRWSVAYLSTRLIALTKALRLATSSSISADHCLAQELLMYPFVDINFLKQSISALADLQYGRQDFQLGRIAYFGWRVNSETSDDQQSMESDETEVNSPSAENSTSNSIANLFRETTGMDTGTEVLVPRQDQHEIHGKDGLLSSNANTEGSEELLSDREEEHDDQSVATSDLSPHENAKATRPAPYSQKWSDKLGKDGILAVRLRLLRDKAARVTQWRSGKLLRFRGKKALKTFDEIIDEARTIGKKVDCPRENAETHKKASKHDVDRAETQKEATKHDGDRTEPFQKALHSLANGSLSGPIIPSEWLLPPHCAASFGAGFPTMTQLRHPGADNRSSNTGYATPATSDGNRVHEIHDAARVAFFPHDYDEDNISLLHKSTMDGSSTSDIVETFKHPFHNALECSNPRKLKDCLRYDEEDVNARGDYAYAGMTPLGLAIEVHHNRPEMIRTLLEGGADISLPSQGHLNALFHVLYSKKYHLVLLFADEAEDAMRSIVNCTNAEDITAFLFVVRSRHVSRAPLLEGQTTPNFLKEVLCRRLIELGADVNVSTTDSKLTALHFAARRGELEIVESIIDAGGNVNAPNRQGRTPLHEAVLIGYLPDVIASLMVAGADPHRQDVNGTTPFDLALGWKKAAEEGALSHKKPSPSGRPEFSDEVPLREIHKLLNILVPGSAKLVELDDHEVRLEVDAELVSNAD